MIKMMNQPGMIKNGMERREEYSVFIAMQVLFQCIVAEAPALVRD